MIGRCHLAGVVREPGAVSPCGFEERRNQRSNDIENKDMPMKGIIKHSISIAFVAIILPLQSGCSDSKWGGDGELSARTTIVDKNTLSPAERTQRFEAAYRAGMTCAERRDYGEAMAAFEEAARLNPESTEALFNLAACYESIGDPLRAIGIYNRILRITPDDADCYHNLGTSYIKLYHLQKTPAWKRMALVAWEKSLKLRPEQPKLREYVARVDDETM